MRGFSHDICHGWIIFSWSWSVVFEVGWAWCGLSPAGFIWGRSLPWEPLRPRVGAYPSRHCAMCRNRGGVGGLWTQELGRSWLLTCWGRGGPVWWERVGLGDGVRVVRGVEGGGCGGVGGAGAGGGGGMIRDGDGGLGGERGWERWDGVGVVREDGDGEILGLVLWEGVVIGRCGWFGDRGCGERGRGWRCCCGVGDGGRWGGYGQRGWGWGDGVAVTRGVWIGGWSWFGERGSRCGDGVDMVKEGESAGMELMRWERVGMAKWSVCWGKVGRGRWGGCAERGWNGDIELVWWDGWRWGGGVVFVRGVGWVIGVVWWDRLGMGDWVSVVREWGLEMW